MALLPCLRSLHVPLPKRRHGQRPSHYFTGRGKEEWTPILLPTLPTEAPLRGAVTLVWVLFLSLVQPQTPHSQGWNGGCGGQGGGLEVRGHSQHRLAQGAATWRPGQAGVSRQHSELRASPIASAEALSPPWAPTDLIVCTTQCEVVLQSGGDHTLWSWTGPVGIPAPPLLAL